MIYRHNIKYSSYHLFLRLTFISHHTRHKRVCLPFYFYAPISNIFSSIDTMKFSTIRIVPFLFAATLSASPIDNDEVAVNAIEKRLKSAPTIPPVPGKDCKDKKAFLSCITNFGIDCWVPNPISQAAWFVTLLRALDSGTISEVLCSHEFCDPCCDGKDNCLSGL